MNRVLWKVILVASCLSYGTGSYADPPYVSYDRPLNLADFNALRLQELLPADAIAYVNAFESCQHWSGEEAYSHERGKDIQEGAERDCAASAALKKKIYRKYPRGSVVRKQLEIVISAAERNDDKFLWYDPEMKSEALRVYYESTAQELVNTTAFMLNNTASVNGDKEDIRRQEKKVRFLLGQANRLHPVTKKQIEEAYKKIQALCDGALSCMKPPKTEIYNVHEICRKDITGAVVVEKLQQLGLEDHGGVYSRHYKKERRTDHTEVVIRTDPKTKAIHDITVSWSNRGDELSYEEIQQLAGLTMPRRGAKEIRVHQETDWTRYSVLGNKNGQHPNRTQVTVACAKDNYDVCWEIQMACFGFVHPD